MKNTLTICILLLVFGSIFFGCKKDEETIAVGPITVNGFVKDYNGQPISGAAVIIAGKTPTTTSASGTFSIPNVTTPYDISVVLSASKAAIVYKGLYRQDPKLLYLESVGAGTYYTATINGFTPIISDRTTRVIFVSGNRASARTTDPTTGTYSRTVTWTGTADSLVGKLYLIRYVTNPAGITDIYDAYAIKNLTIKNGITYNNQNFSNSDLINPPDLSISGTMPYPADYTLSFRYLYMMFGEALVYLAPESTPLLGDFSISVPSIPDIKFAIWGGASKGTYPNSQYTSFRKVGIAAGATSVNIKLETAPHLALPLNNSTNIDTLTDFTWTQGGGEGINLFIIYPAVYSTPPVNPTYYIFTAGNTIRLPNLSSQGLGLPANTGYQWYVYKYFPVPSVDDIASDTFRKLWYGEALMDFGYGGSETFNFTTKP